MLHLAVEQVHHCQLDSVRVSPFTTVVVQFGSGELVVVLPTGLNENSPVLDDSSCHDSLPFVCRYREVIERLFDNLDATDKLTCRR